MQRTSIVLLCSVFWIACGADEHDGYVPPRDEEMPPAAADEEEELESTGPGDESGGIEEADDPRLADEVDPEAVANTDPLLKWVLYAQPGIARLVAVNPMTGVASTVRTHVFANHWLPIGVAGNRLLWQRTDTFEISLWTIDANGNYVSHVVHQPGAGWRVRGINFDQDAQCPAPNQNANTYTLLLEGTPVNPFAQWPRPWLWHLDNVGAITSTEQFPLNYQFSTLKEFRTTADGYGALIYQSQFVVAGDGTTIDWFGRDGNGALMRLRTDSYSAADGYRACTPRQPNVQCFNDFADEVPGAGHELTSMVTTATAGGTHLPATYLLWSKTDGTAKTYRLGLYTGKLLAPAAPITTPHVGSSAVSLAGQLPSPCPIIADPQDPPEWPADPVIDVPGCIEC